MAVQSTQPTHTGTICHQNGLLETRPRTTFRSSYRAICQAVAIFSSGRIFPQTAAIPQDIRNMIPRIKALGEAALSEYLQLSSLIPILPEKQLVANNTLWFADLQLR
jgi:hypothetical protein